MTGLADVKAVLFDRDDTLSLTDQQRYLQAAEWLRERHGVDPRDAARQMLAQWASASGRWEVLRTVEQEEAFWQLYGAELAARLQLPEQAGHEMMREWPYWRFMTPAPGVREVLLALRARGLKIGVLSNTLPNVAATLEAVGIGDVVDVALSTCALGVHKPEPRAFRLAAEALGVKPEQVVFVDDRPENIEAARLVGMQAYLIDHAGQQEGALTSLDALLSVLSDE